MLERMLEEPLPSVGHDPAQQQVTQHIIMRPMPHGLDPPVAHLPGRFWAFRRHLTAINQAELRVVHHDHGNWFSR